MNNIPGYIELFRTGELEKRKKELIEKLEKCDLCPRNCGVNRLKDELGFCQTGRLPIVSSYHLHFGEEPPISGYRGSGTIFFTYCNLSCVFCQNYTISQEGEGYKITTDKLAKMMIYLQEEGAHNINFVTPTHVVPQIIEALLEAIPLGLNIPLVYNSGGYDSVSTLKLLEGIFDIYMPDAKYGSDEYAMKYSKAPNYTSINQSALIEMHRQVGVLQLDKSGIATRGLLIRHLVLPNDLASSEKIFAFIAENLSKDTYISLMSQYYPCNKAYLYPELNRRITYEEYKTAVALMYKYGLTRAHLQMRVY